MSAPVTSFQIQVHLTLDRFSLEVNFAAKHRVTGLFGASGSGKTSLVETIAGLRKAATGHIRCGDQTWLDSKSRLRRPPEDRQIGYMPQDHLLFPHRSVRGNLLSGRHPTDPRERDHIFQQVVEILELGPLISRSVGQLSGGERQRVALGRALCAGPRLLLLDEPLASLDLGLRRRILPFLRRVRDHFALPMLIVSHHPTELHALCDEIIVLKEGRIIATGEPGEIFTRPDIFALADRIGFENILPGRLASRQEHTAVVQLGARGEGPALVVLRPDCGDRAALLVGIAASEILLAERPPVGLSARNYLQAKVEQVEQAGHCVLVTTRVAADLPPLVVEITGDAAEQLRITPNATVCLVIKSSSITVYA